MSWVMPETCRVSTMRPVAFVEAQSLHIGVTDLRRARSPRRACAPGRFNRPDRAVVIHACTRGIFGSDALAVGPFKALATLKTINQSA